MRADTEFGPCAVLICYDAESEDLIQETLAASPIAVFNPIHISTGASAITTGVNAGKARRSQWRIACDAIGRRFEWLAATSGCTFVRCDQPYPVGSGTSQVFTHDMTRRIKGDESGNTLFALIRPPQIVRGASGTQTIVPMDTSDWVTNPSPGNDRSEKEDNVGTKVLQRCLAVSGSAEGDRIVSVALVKAHGLPKGLLAAVWSSGRVTILDVARTEVDGTIQSRLPVDGVASVDERGAYVEEVAPVRPDDAPPLPPAEWGKPERGPMLPSQHAAPQPDETQTRAQTYLFPSPEVPETVVYSQERNAVLTGLRQAGGAVTKGGGGSSCGGGNAHEPANAAGQVVSERATVVGAVAVGQWLVLALRRRGGEAGTGDVLLVLSPSMVVSVKSGGNSTALLADAIASSCALDSLASDGSSPSPSPSPRVVSFAASTAGPLLLGVGMDDGTVATLLVGQDDGSLTHLGTHTFAGSAISTVAVDAKKSGGAAGSGCAVSAIVVAGTAGGEVLAMGLDVGAFDDAAATTAFGPVETLERSRGVAEDEDAAGMAEEGGSGGDGVMAANGSITAVSTSTIGDECTRQVCAVDAGGRLLTWVAEDATGSALSPSPSVWTLASADLPLVPETTALRPVPTAPGWHLSASRDRTVRLWDTRKGGLALHHTFNTAGSVSDLVVLTSSFPLSTKLALVLDDRLELWDFIHNRNPVALGKLLHHGG